MRKEAFSLKKYQLFFVWAVLLQIFVLSEFSSFNQTALFLELVGLGRLGT
tara:strand:- start:7 stop:156 length:150 start_codon:yes stop_codon:yes gene_type:complete